MADVGSALARLLSGLRVVGDAFTELMLWLLGQLGLQPPEIAVRIATITFIILVVWKYSGAISRIALYILLFILLSTATGLLPSIPSFF